MGGKKPPARCCEGHGARVPAVFEVHDSDVEGLLRSLRDESQAINDGVVLLRGLPFSSTEEDIVDFFPGTPAPFVLGGRKACTSAGCSYERGEPKPAQP